MRQFGLVVDVEIDKFKVVVGAGFFGLIHIFKK